ncbi:MAG: helix-turn-helix domain containing protein [Negativicutes bacterium]|nr:helix-turn-helix domain containing protein [Negativicutes bacterium]
MKDLFSCDGKKSDLLKAGLDLFAARGFDAVSVRDIAKAAGVSEAALYKHFSGKQDMALYIFSSVITAYTGRLDEVHAQPLSAVEKLCRVVNITYGLYESFPAEIRFALLWQYNWWERVPEESKPHFVLKAILQQGMEAGEIPRQEVYFWIMVFSGIMLQPLAQYPYFRDVLPPLSELGEMVAGTVRKLFGQNPGQ